MGAIAGILFRERRVDLAAARAMIAASPHRGDLGPTATIGRAVLATTVPGELQDASLWSDGTLAVAFSGSLDNAEELARQLNPQVQEGLAQEPAAIVASAFGAHGERLPERLRGMYACVITDGEAMWCFRDHLGLATLFYRDDVPGFFAATEAKQVVAGSRIPYEPDLEVLEAIFYSDYDDETPSALKGVRRLPKSMLLEARDRRSRIQRYWHPERLLETATMTRDEVADGFHDLMEQAVTRSLGGDDVIALSGGIDSPALAAYAAPVQRRKAGRALAALSAVYPQMPSCDESEYIEIVARDLQLELHTFQRARPSMEGLQEWVRLFDGPAPQWTVSQGEEFHRKARELGFRTIMTGEVAEFVIDARHHVVDHLLWQGRLPSAFRYLSSERASGASWKYLYRTVAGALAPRPLLAGYLRMHHTKDVYRPVWLQPQTELERPQYRSYLMPPRERWRQGQLTGFNGPGLSMEADSIAQAIAGVRTRRPWADVDLWEFFLRMRAEAKFPRAETKGLVRRLLRGRVPDAILDRTDKTHFNEYVMTGIDYPVLRKWLTNPEHRLAGVDYVRLAERLEAEDLRLYDYIWARDLAAVHAFLALW
jgi:asparagine synthetase B (glutamine-hydrolysing)